MSFYQLKVRLMNSIMMMLYGKMLHFIIIMWLYKSKEVQYDELTTRNPALVKSFPITPKRTEFFKENGFTFEEKVKRLAKKTFSMKTLAYRIVRKVIPNAIVKILRRFLR